MDKASLIIPCRNEEKYIKLCLESLIKNDYPDKYKEILVIDALSSDNTRKIVSKIAKKISYIKMIDNPEIYTPFAFNIGIKHSKGKHIILINAHSVYPVNYISSLVHYQNKLNADNVGGIFKPKSLNKNRKTNAILKVLSNKLGVGNAHFRTGIKVNEPKIVDTAAFGCYRREVFDRIGYFDERLARNQDIEFNKRLMKNRGKTYLIPGIECYYYVRESFKEIAVNNFQNGFWVILTSVLTKNPNSLSLRHFVPLIFLLSLIVPVIFSFFYFYLIFLSIISFILYNFVIMKESFNLSDSETGFINLIKTFYILHFSYGTGSLLSFFYLFKKLIFNKKNEKYILFL